MGYAIFCMKHAAEDLNNRGCTLFSREAAKTAKKDSFGNEQTVKSHRLRIRGTEKSKRPPYEEVRR